MESRTDHTTDVLEKKIDRIITKALLFASNVNESGLRNMYNDSRLQELFFERILSLIFENDIELKTWFESSEVATEVFKKLIKTGNNYPLCEDCANDLPCELCSLVIGDYEQYQIEKSFKNYDKKSYNNGIHPASSDGLDGYAKHGTSGNLFELSDRFVKHVVSIIRHLTKYLELFCLDGGLLENKVEELTNVNNENVNDNIEHDPVNHDMNDGSHISQKSCVVLLSADKTQLSKFKLCFKSDKISWKEGQDTTISSSFGYIYIPYMDNEEECNKIRTEINTYIQNNFRKSRMHCVVVKIFRLFFMRIVCIITNIIQKLCLCEEILCDKISEIIVNETQLPALILFKHGFGNGLGKNLLFRIFTTISYSETGRLCLAKIYLENFEKIYSAASTPKYVDSFITDLAHRFAASRTVLLYLVEGGLLSKIFYLISKRLVKLGFGQKDSILLVVSRSGSTRIDELYDALSKLHVMLYCPAPKFEATDRLIGELRNVGTRLVEFCLAFDDMEQIRNGYENLGRSIDSESVSFFILELHNLMVAYVIWIVTYGQIHNKVLELFLHVFQNHLKKSTANLSPSVAFERLVMRQDVENKQFSMFNLSKRVFFDLLTHSLVNNCLSPELKQSLFHDQMLLISISKSAITALSFEVYYKAGHWINPSEYFDDLIFNYRHISFVHYLFMQDFVAVQILISCMNPTYGNSHYATLSPPYYHKQNIQTVSASLI
ncbi:hypothetical protein RF11_04168 [Thelohanellus kitauei]|uniref:Uncharacterized protein n=1 Tax=Thelohanellus kitauei TaxID=669202 RepID=A0A0C2MID9_THEKT|nr:hypothetical protein RF11_04168 [Thelohanellus kitauei]